MTIQHLFGHQAPLGSVSLYSLRQFNNQAPLFSKGESCRHRGEKGPFDLGQPFSQNGSTITPEQTVKLLAAFVAQLIGQLLQGNGLDALPGQSNADAINRIIGGGQPDRTGFRPGGADCQSPERRGFSPTLRGASGPPGRPVSQAELNYLMKHPKVSKVGRQLLQNPQFMAKAQQVAGSLGVPTGDLLKVMAFESGINPFAKNKMSGATGLIQFMPKTARGLGTSTAALASGDPLSAAMNQLDYVHQYYQPYKGRLKDLGDLYQATLYPAKLGKSGVIGAPGTAVYRQNRVFDTQRKGYFTVADVRNHIYSVFRGSPELQGARYA